MLNPCDRPSGGMHEAWQHDILSIPAERMPSAGNRLICKQTVLTEPTSPKKYGVGCATCEQVLAVCNRRAFLLS